MQVCWFLIEKKSLVIMGSQSFLGFLLVIFFLMMVGFLSGSSQAYQFHVGGRDGWVLNPSENYTIWAQKNRFQVNDTLCKLHSLIILIFSTWIS